MMVHILNGHMHKQHIHTQTYREKKSAVCIVRFSIKRYNLMKNDIFWVTVYFIYLLLNHPLTYIDSEKFFSTIKIVAIWIVFVEVQTLECRQSLSIQVENSIWEKFCNCQLHFIIFNTVNSHKAYKTKVLKKNAT